MKKLVLIIFIATAGMQFAISQKQNSKFGGVQIGAITYSYRSMPDQSLEGVLNCIVQSGINSVELLAASVEKFAGIPDTKDAAAIRQWRTSVSMDKYNEAKKMFNKRGVKIHLLNVGFNTEMSDEEIDYFFKVCKALGANAVNTEISEEIAKRLSPFADKHKMYVTFHNHGQPGNPDFSFDRVLAHGQRLRLNFDVGHYYNATGLNPCDVIKRLHNRIFSIHLKDKTGPPYADTNRPFGEGETPLVEILQLIQKEKWPVYCDIEQEYKISPSSDAVKEVINCVEYCRKALMK